MHVDPCTIISACRDPQVITAIVQGPPCDGGGCADPHCTALASTELFFSAAALGSGPKQPVSDTTGVFGLLLSVLKATSGSHVAPVVCGDPPRQVCKDTPPCNSDWCAGTPLQWGLGLV